MELGFPSFILLLVSLFSLGLIVFLSLLSFVEKRMIERRSSGKEVVGSGCIRYGVFLIIGFNLLLWGLHLGWLSW